MKKILSILKSKTVLYALALAVLSVLQGFVFAIPISPFYQMLIGILIAACIVVLRAVTNAPLIKEQANG